MTEIKYWLISEETLVLLLSGEKDAFSSKDIIREAKFQELEIDETNNWIKVWLVHERQEIERWEIVNFSTNFVNVDGLTYPRLDPSKQESLGKCINCGQESYYTQFVCSIECEKELEQW